MLYEVITGRAQRGQDLAHLFGQEAEQVYHLLRRAGKARAQFRLLGADADRAFVGMALAYRITSYNVCYTKLLRSV